MLIIVGPAAPPVFPETVSTVAAGSTSPVCSAGVFEPPSPDTAGSPRSRFGAAGRLRGASAGGIHGGGFLRSRFAPAGSAVEVDAGSSVGGSHGAGSALVRSRLAGTGAAVDDAGNSGGTQGAGTLPASSLRKIANPVLRSGVLRSVICPLADWGKACTASQARAS